MPHLASLFPNLRYSSCPRYFPKLSCPHLIGASTSVRSYSQHIERLIHNPQSPKKPLVYDVSSTCYLSSTGTTPLNRANFTNLYQAFSNRSYIFGCCFIGTGLIAAGMFNGSTIAVAHKRTAWRERGIPSYVPAFTFISSLFLIAGGGFFCLKVCAKIVNIHPLFTSN